MKSKFDGLSEFIIRRGRMKILKTLLEKEKSVAEAARKLNVTRTAVYGWKNEKKRHPSNEHTREMLEILAQENKNKIREILLKELQNFQQLIFKF